MNNTGVYALYSVGPNHDTKCYAFSAPNCQIPFYPMTKPSPNSDWEFKYPGEADTHSPVKSFRCEMDI